MSREKLAEVCIAAIATTCLSLFAWSWKKEVDRYKGIKEEHEKYIKYLDSELERSKIERDKAMLGYNSMVKLYEMVRGDDKNKATEGTDMGVSD